MHPSQRKILDHVKKHPNDSLQKIADAIEVSGTSVVVHHVNQLIKQKLLKRGKKWVTL